jgi:hypothetical protein
LRFDSFGLKGCSDHRHALACGERIIESMAVLRAPYNNHDFLHLGQNALQRPKMAFVKGLKSSHENCAFDHFLSSTALYVHATRT